MKSIKYRYSGGHKTVLDIGDNDALMRVAINLAIEKYKECFKHLCKSYYKEDCKNFVYADAIKGYKKTIRTYIAMRDALDKSFEIEKVADARTIASQLF